MSEERWDAPRRHGMSELAVNGFSKKHWEAPSADPKDYARKGCDTSRFEKALAVCIDYAPEAALCVLAVIIAANLAR